MSEIKYNELRDLFALHAMIAQLNDIKKESDYLEKRNDRNSFLFDSKRNDVCERSNEGKRRGRVTSEIKQKVSQKIKCWWCGNYIEPKTKVCWHCVMSKRWR